jgi:predicted DsbA family dithiol-disulfide isomerase
MAESGLDSLRQTHAVNVEWRAFELRPTGTPPLSPEYRARIMRDRPRVQQIARERFHLEMKQPEPKPPGATFLAHVGAKFAAEHGQGEAYHRAVFRAHWQDDRDIASPDVLAAIARSLNLEAAAFRAALVDNRYVYTVLEDEEWAARHGLGAVPAFIFGGRYLVSGAQPVEVLREVADRCLVEGLTE